MSLASMSWHHKGSGVQCHWQVCMGIKNVGCAMSLASMSGIANLGACNIIGKYVWASQR